MAELQIQQQEAEMNCLKTISAKKIHQTIKFHKLCNHFFRYIKFPIQFSHV